MCPGPLNKEAGDALMRHGITLINIIGATEYVLAVSFCSHPLD